MIRALSLFLAALLAAAAAQGAAAPPSRAQSGDVVVRALPGGGGGAEMLIRGRPAMKLSGPDALRRLRLAAGRLTPLPRKPVKVAGELRPGAAHLTVDGAVVLTLLPDDAKRSGETLRGMAARMVRTLAAALVPPPLLPTPGAVVLSVGGTATVLITASTPGATTVGAFDRQVVDVARAGDLLTITGIRVGSTVIRLAQGKHSAQVAVSVRPPAGVVPESVEVSVTGAPAPIELMREAVRRRLQDAVRLEPGASLEIGEVSLEGPLPQGGTASARVNVGVRSPFAGPVHRSVEVRVANLPVALAEPDLLLVSNRPEVITDSGLLFHETLDREKSARLLYHHMNGGEGKARVLKITLANPSGFRVLVHYASGIAGPSPDPVFVGFSSTARFLERLVNGRGYVVEVAPRGAVTFNAYTLAPNALVSGLMQFQVIEGGPVELSVHVRLPWLLDRTVTTDLGPWAFPHPRGTFPGAPVEVVRELRAGEPAPVADLGIMSEARDVRTGESLVGDYGILYRLRLRVTNPTDREATVSLVAHAAGGLARGLFYVDREPVDIGLLRPREERVVGVFAIPAGAARELLIVTMPVAGSYYPVRLSLRPR